jgi:tetratricopeptide (TPR) repeat protein/transglutaminase-like putative cysteine protease
MTGLLAADVARAGAAEMLLYVALVLLLAAGGGLAVAAWRWGVHRKSAIALALVLFAAAGGAACAVAWIDADRAGTVGVLLGAMASMVLVVVGVVLAWAVGTGSVVGLALVGFLVLGLTRLVEQPTAPQAAPLAKSADAQRVLRYPELNFSFAQPDLPWIPSTAGRANPDATLAFERTRPQVQFLVIAEAPGVEQTLQIDALAEFALNQLRQTAVVEAIDQQQQAEWGGIAGLRIVSRVRMSGRPFVHVQWVASHNGYLYQLVAFGPASQAAAVERSADEMFARFRVEDPTQVAHAPRGRPADEHRSPRFGYRIALDRDLWHRWENLAEVVPEAEWGALAGEATRLLTIPVTLLDHDPRLEALTHALLLRLGIAFGNASVEQLVPAEIDGGQGHQFELRREVGGVAHRYRVLVAKRGGCGYLFAAWTSQPDAGPLLETALAQVQFAPQPPSPPAAAELTGRQKLAHAQVFNDLGLYHYEARQFVQSAEYFRTAFELRQSDPIILLNLVNARIELNQHREALDDLLRHIDQFPQQHELWASRAFLEARLERFDEALETYARLFAQGYRGGSAIAHYVGLLANLDREEEALARLAEFQQQGESPALQRLEASLYSRLGDHARAIALLELQQRSRPFSAELAYDLAECYLAAERYDEALAVCRQLLERRYDSADTYLLKGQSELALKWYADAKQSFEAALARAPADRDAQALLEFVSGMLGEGNNSAVKEPIDAVAIPESLLALDPWEEDDDRVADYGAYYLKRITAVQFEPAKDLKTTDRRTVRVRDRSGVVRFSTFQVSFNPLAEQVYVNTLLVTDGNGRVVATGKPSDYYVIDSAEGNDAASQLKVLNVPVSGLQPGYTIEFVVTRRDLTPPAAMPFVNHVFLYDVPVVESVFFLRAPLDGIVYRSSSDLTARNVEGGLCWTLTDPPVYRWEPLQWDVDDFLPRVCVNAAAASWERLVAEYLDAIEDRLTVEAPVRALAERLTASATNDREKVSLLAEHVQDDFTYKAIVFGRRARIPNTPSQIVQNKYGDCKDHSILLHVLLKAAGIESHLALVNTVGAVEADMPSLDQFDHMILYVPDVDGGLFIDATNKDAPPLSSASLGLGDKQALVLDRQQPRPIAIPAYPADANRVASARNVRLINESDIEVEETLTLEGYYASYLRGVLRRIQPANRPAAVQSQLSPGNGLLQVEKLDIEHLNDKDLPLVLRLTYIVKEKFHAVNGTVLGQIPAPWEQLYIAAQHLDQRRTPFAVCYPVQFTSSIRLSAPPGCAIGPMDLFNAQQQTPFASWRLAAEPIGDDVELTFRFEDSAGRYSADEYPAYQASMEQAVRALAKNVVFHRLR